MLYWTQNPIEAIKSILLVLISLSCGSLQADDTNPPVIYNDGNLSNGYISLSFEADGTFSIRNTQSKEILLEKARFALPRRVLGKVVKMYAENIEDDFGIGK